MDRHHRVLQVRARQRIERAERLVEQQHLRLHGQRAGDADALLHAARDLRRPLVLGVRHLHEVEIVHGPVMALGAATWCREHLVDREAHVVVDGEPRQQAVVLEHDGAVRARARCTSRFSSSTPPRVACVRPATMLSSVDLPQPEWPMMETNSPFSTSSVMSCKHFGLLRAAREGLVDVIDLEIASSPAPQLRRRAARDDRRR